MSSGCTFTTFFPFIHEYVLDIVNGGIDVGNVQLGVFGQPRRDL
jgi:hypothetical protein